MTPRILSVVKTNQGYVIIIIFLLLKIKTLAFCKIFIQNTKVEIYFMINQRAVDCKKMKKIAV